MAGVSSKEIKNRIRSMESTRQITRAMEMVASSKLRKAQNQALAARPYYETLLQTLKDVASASGDCQSPYLRPEAEGPTAWVVIAGDRGLAGGYNGNVLKLALQDMDAREDRVVPIGRKAVEFFTAKGYTVFSKALEEVGPVTASHCYSLAKDLCQAFLRGQIGRVQVVYTRFDSVLSQTPYSLQLLPMDLSGAAGSGTGVIYEPDPETVLSAVVPEYVGGMLYGLLCESRASEQAARRTAMNAATENADEMIGDLSLQYNRARQAAITQEITEIIAGS